MTSGIYTATSGAIARQMQLDTVSYNLANVDTAGFRGASESFEEVLAGQNVTQRQVRRTGLELDTSQGFIDPTGNPLDVAVEGRAFLVVGLEDRTALTRDGRMSLDMQNRLVSRDGHPLLNTEGQPIVIPSGSTDLRIDEKGRITDRGGLVGQLAMMDVPNPETLRAEGPGRYAMDDQEMTVAEDSQLRQGAVERSNVNVVRGMTELITLQRHFETMQQLLTTYKTVDQRAIDGVGRPPG